MIKGDSSCWRWRFGSCLHRSSPPVSLYGNGHDHQTRPWQMGPSNDTESCQWINGFMGKEELSFLETFLSILVKWRRPTEFRCRKNCYDAINCGCMYRLRWAKRFRRFPRVNTHRTGRNNCFPKHSYLRWMTCEFWIILGYLRAYGSKSKPVPIARRFCLVLPWSFTKWRYSISVRPSKLSDSATRTWHIRHSIGIGNTFADKRMSLVEATEHL